MAVMITFSTTLNSGFGHRAENKQKFGIWAWKKKLKNVEPMSIG